MKPSFLQSTLSLAFILCVISTIAMIFMRIIPDPILFGVISGVVGAYVGSRLPKNEDKPKVEVLPTETLE